MLALTGQPVFGTLDVAGVQRAQNGFVTTAVFGVPGHRHLIPLAVHMVDQPAQVLAGDIRFQGPGNVGVAEDHAGIGYPFHHHVFVDHLVFQHHLLAINPGFDAPQHLYIQARGRNDDVGFQFLAGFQANTGFGKALDVIGFDRRGAGLDGLEQVAVFHHAQALVPGVVVRAEVAHVGLAVELAFDDRQEQAAHGFRAFTGALEQEPGNGNITGPGQPVGGPGWQYFLHGQGDFVG